MPIVQCAGRLVYYSHVPKCAGSSVEDYLAARFGPLFFLDRHWLSVPEANRWGRSSPQHMPVAMLRSMFPEDHFAAHFAVVRHPVRRLVSAFLHNRNHGKINPMIGLHLFLRRLKRADRSFHERTDNHFRPAVHFVDPSARVFRLEDGEQPIIAWLDALAGNSDGPRSLPRVNEKSAPPPGAIMPWSLRMMQKLQPALPELDQTILRRVHRIYREDYERFGYDPYRP